MKTCPSCSRMYSDGVATCPKCGVSLDSPQPVRQSVTYTRPAPSVSPQNTYTPPAAPVEAVPVQPVSAAVSAGKGNLVNTVKNCSFDIYKSEADVGKFKALGCETGTIDVYEHQLDLFAKNKVLSRGFGLVGYLVAGKGSLAASVHIGDVRGCKRNFSKRHPLVLLLNDGRAIWLQNRDELDPFLNQCREL